MASIEFEFAIGEPVFGVVHGTFKPDVIRGVVDYVTVDDKDIVYTVTEVETGTQWDLQGMDITSDFMVALALAANYEKQWKEHEIKVLKQHIRYLEANLAEAREKLKEYGEDAS